MTRPLPEIARLLVASMDHIGDAVLLTEGETTEARGGAERPRRIIYVNEAFVKMTGFSREEALGQTPSITVGPGTERDVLEQIQEAREKRVSVRVELLKYRKDGSTLWVELFGIVTQQS